MRLDIVVALCMYKPTFISNLYKTPLSYNVMCECVYKLNIECSNFITCWYFILFIPFPDYFYVSIFNLADKD